MVIPPMLTVVLHTMKPFVGGGAPQHANVLPQSLHGEYTTHITHYCTGM